MQNSARLLKSIESQIHHCQKCPRLRKYCENIAEVKRRAYMSETYWGKPITGFGDPAAGLVIVGLAPAAHGANRTGRIFTGDRSGDWLFRALHKAGFCNQPTSVHQNDGLALQNAYITCIVKCAPPDNKPTPEEQGRCSDFLKSELSALNKASVWIALGQLAYQRIWPLLNADPLLRKPPFGHGVFVPLGSDRWLLLSYHPSQQNTFTGRLTEPMFDSIFSKAKELLKK